MVKVFLSYAHADEALQKELNEHLAALKRENLIEAWWDRQIPPGNEWSVEIARQLEEADLILLLVSSAFLNSTYCYEKEMRRAVERHEAGTARVVPILLRPCYWQPAPFAKLQGLPEGTTPVTNWGGRNKRDAIWAEVAKGIHCAAELCGVAAQPSPASSPMPLLNSPKHASMAESHAGPGKPEQASDKPTISLTSLSAVDEEGLDSAIERFGTDWHEARITWPRSSDKVVSIIQDALGRFDEEGTGIVGSEYFIKNAPSALATAVRGRAMIQERLPGLVSRCRGFNRECIKTAVRNYLLLANLELHRKLGYLSTWEGLIKLNFEAPAAWIPFLNIYSEGKTLARLFDSTETGDIYHGRLHHIGDHAIITKSKINFIYLWAPRHVLHRHNVNISDQSEICTWLVPQIEFDHEEVSHPDRYPRISLPDIYTGDWKFNVIKDTKGEEVD